MPLLGTHHLIESSIRVLVVVLALVVVVVVKVVVVRGHVCCGSCWGNESHPCPCDIFFFFVQFIRKKSSLNIWVVAYGTFGINNNSPVM